MMPLHAPMYPPQDSSIPAGLRNLGNTCYVNTALQCLFSIPGFRSALLRATAGPPRSPAGTSGADEPDAAALSSSSSPPSVPWDVDEVTGTLRDLFLDLQFGPATYAGATLSLQLIMQSCSLNCPDYDVQTQQPLPRVWSWSMGCSRCDDDGYYMYAL